MEKIRNVDVTEDLGVESVLKRIENRRREYGKLRIQSKKVEEDHNKTGKM